MDYEFLWILIYLVYYYILFFIYRWYRLVLLLIDGIVKEKVYNYVKDLNKLNIEVFIFFICIVFFFVLVSCFYRERLLI